jgi:hypothetical protein
MWIYTNGLHHADPPERRTKASRPGSRSGAGPHLQSVAVPWHRRFGLAIGMAATRPLAAERTITRASNRRVGIVQHPKPRRLEPSAVIQARTRQHGKRRRANHQTSTLAAETLIGRTLGGNVNDVSRAGASQRREVDADRAMPTDFFDRRFGYIKWRKPRSGPAPDREPGHC